MSSRLLLIAVRIGMGTALLSVLIMGVFAKRGWLDWRRMVRQNERLESRMELARLEKAELENRLLRLRRNAVEQERVVREVLGYVREGEILIEF